MSPSPHSGQAAEIREPPLGTVDQFVLNALLQVEGLQETCELRMMHRESLSTDEGVCLIRIMQRKSSENNQKFGTNFWTPRKMDMILWAYGHGNQWHVAFPARDTASRCRAGTDRAKSFHTGTCTDHTASKSRRARPEQSEGVAERTLRYVPRELLTRGNSSAHWRVSIRTVKRWRFQCGGRFFARPRRCRRQE
jgi:hypothetical protein